MMNNLCEMTIYNNNFFLKKKLFSLLYDIILKQSSNNTYIKSANNILTLYEIKISLVNLLKGEYLEKIKTIMILINKYKFLTKIQLIEIISYKLNLYIDEDYFINNNEANKFSDFDNYLIAENIVEDVLDNDFANSLDYFTLEEINYFYESKNNIFLILSFSKQNTNRKV